jgi:flagellar brake protein
MLTQPMPLSLPRPKPGRSDNRVRTSREIRALLRQFSDQDVPITLATPDGVSYATCLWAHDPDRAVLVLSADATDARVQRLVEAEEAVAVGYLDSVKVQFDLHGLMLVHGRDTSALHAHFPREIYRFQRRSGLRVRPKGQTCTELRLRLPGSTDAELTMRVLDLSHGGLAVLWPEDLTPPAIGVTVRAARLALDSETHVQVALRVVHVGTIAHGKRLGCEIQGLSGVAVRTLERYIDESQKRFRLLAAP